MHNDAIVRSAIDAHKLGGGTASRSRQSGFLFRRWAGALVAIAAAVLVFAGCADSGGGGTAAGGGGTTTPTPAAPMVSARLVSVIGTTASIELTVNEPRTLFWVLYADGSPAPADAAALIADAGKAKTASIVANSGSSGQTLSAAGNAFVLIPNLIAGINYDFYAAARGTAGSTAVHSAKLDFSAVPSASGLTVTVDGATTSARLNWNNPESAASSGDATLSRIEISWALTSGVNRANGPQIFTSTLTAGAAVNDTISDLMVGRTYRFSVAAVYSNGSRSSTVTVDGNLLDGDNDTLIDIHNLDMLNNARHSLAGTYYTETADATSGQQCGASGTTACSGYELMRNLDFATAASYASGSINNTWRPTNAGGMVVAPASATSAGWVPIGTIFSGIFDGNGRTISNLYVRNSTGGDYGLFGQLSGTVRNLGVVNGAVYGTGDVGIVAGQTNSGSTIIASYASGTANGLGSDAVGGLVGNNNGIIIASYASSTADAGAGNIEFAGGLVGANGIRGTIIASYASGTADGGAGQGDSVGGLVGVNRINSLIPGIVGTIIASYATGNADAGMEVIDEASSLVAVNNTGAIITSSYGFGIATGAGIGDPGSTDRPTGVGAAGSGIAGARKLTAPGTTTPLNTAVPAAWNAADSNTLGAWDFGTAMQAPALKYADYDGAGTVYNCNQFPVACGTLIPGQTALR